MTSVIDVSQALKQVDASSYDANADAFDRLTERYSASLAKHMVGLAGLQASDNVLDLGSGTGLLALQAATCVASGQVVGIDHSQTMLDYARAKAVKRGLAERASFAAMDAEALEFADGHFDAILSLYVLRHLPNVRAAVAEMHRVLKPGGRIVVSVGARPALMSKSGPQAAIRSMADKILVPAGRRALAPAFLRTLLAGHGIARTHNHAAEHHLDDVAALLRAAGFANVQSEWRGEEFALEPEDFWDVQATFDSEARTMLDPLDAAHVARLKDEFLARAGEIGARGGQLLYRTGALVCWGRR